MTDSKRKNNEPHDQFIKQFVPVVLKNLFESQTNVSIQLGEELVIAKSNLADRYVNFINNNNILCQL